MSITEAIRPTLQTVFESLAETNIYWEEKPRPYAGPGYVNATATPGVGGIQGTIKITELDSPGEDILSVREATVTVENPAGIEYVNDGTRSVIVQLKLWSWSQRDDFHAHGYTDKIRTKLLQPDREEFATLRAAGISHVRTEASVNLETVEDSRSITTSVIDLLFYVCPGPSALVRPGYVIESVTIDGRFLGGVNSHVEGFTSPVATLGAPRSVEGLWTPASARKPIVWWAGEDGLDASGHWVDRIGSHRLREFGSGPSDLTVETDALRSGVNGYLATVEDIPTHTSSDQYVWAYMEIVTPTDPLKAIFLSLFLDSPEWHLMAEDEGGGDLLPRLQADGATLSDTFGADVVGSRALVGAYITADTARLDVNGVAGPTIAITARDRSALQVGAWGDTDNGPGLFRSDFRVFSVGMCENEDLKDKVFGYVATRYG